MSFAQRLSSVSLAVASVVAAGSFSLALPATAHAVAPSPSSPSSQADLPGRVGRVAEVQGKAWFFDEEQQRWSEAQRNRAITEGDRFQTERGSRLQLGIGSTEFRLSGDTEITFERLDEDRVRVSVQRGSLALRVRSREVVRELELRSAHGRFWPEKVGHYRIDRADGRTVLTAWRGALAVDAQDQRLVVETGRSAELMREGRDGTVVSWGNVEQDEFSDWVARDEQRDDRASSERWISPEMTGANELDRHGRWDRHPEYGMVWSPLRVSVDWAPFRHGRWTWHVRWGWTWMDDAPWGFATSHYGRWSSWGGRWVWVPGAYVARPVYAPALVGWVGGAAPGVSVNINLGPSVSWIPLAPRDVYVPHFRHSPRYVERVNQPHRWPGAPAQVPTGPVMYGNNGVPHAVTVVPGAVLQQRLPVAPAVVVQSHRDRSDGHDHGDRRENREPRGGRDGRAIARPVSDVNGPVVSMPAQTEVRRPGSAGPGLSAPAVQASPPARPVQQGPAPEPKVSPKNAEPAPKVHRPEGLRERREQL